MMKKYANLSDDEWRDCGALTAYLIRIPDEMTRAKEIAKIIAYAVMLEKEVTGLRHELGRDETEFVPLLGLVKELEAAGTIRRRQTDDR